MVFLKFTQHKHVVNILCLNPHLIRLKTINLNTEPHMYKTYLNRVYSVEVDGEWVPALNVTFGMYNGDTLVTGIPTTLSAPRFLQRRVFITLPHGEFQRFRSFHYMIASVKSRKEVHAGVTQRWDTAKIFHEHVIDIGSHAKYITEDQPGKRPTF